MNDPADPEIEKQRAEAERKMQEIFLKPQVELAKRLAALEKGLGVIYKRLGITNELLDRDILPELQEVANVCGQDGPIIRLVQELDRLNKNLENPPAGGILAGIADILKR